MLSERSICTTAVLFLCFVSFVSSIMDHGCRVRCMHALTTSSKLITVSSRSIRIRIPTWLKAVHPQTHHPACIPSDCSLVISFSCILYLCFPPPRMCSALQSATQDKVLTVYVPRSVQLLQWNLVQVPLIGGVGDNGCMHWTKNPRILLSTMRPVSAKACSC